VTVVPGGREAAQRAEQAFPGVPAISDEEGRIARAFGVPAAPAAAVIDRRGRLVYVGSYNVARFCDNEETAYAAAAVQAALRGEKPKVASVPFFGCGSPAAAASASR
jgi:peroxiredoxin